MPPELAQLLTNITQSTAFQIAKFTAYGLLALSWLAMIVHVSKDSEKRIEREGLRLLTVLLPFFLWLPGWLFYLLFRPAQTLAEKKSFQILEQELQAKTVDVLCAGCGYEAADGFLYCPQCGESLYTPCSECAQPLKPEWRFCPYCRKEVN